MLSPEQVLEIIKRGEDQQNEFKETIRDATTLARLIAAFANSGGGRVLVGVREPDRVVGTDASRLNQLLVAALERLDPSPSATLSHVPVDGVVIGIVEVPASHHLVFADGGVFGRVGAMIRALPPSEVARMLSAGRDDVQDSLPRMVEAMTKQSALVEAQSEALQRQEQTIKELSEKFAKSQAPAGKIVEWLISGVIGAILGVLATALLG